MLTRTSILLGASAMLAHADLLLEQQSSDSNHTHTAILKLHGDKMRLDQPADALCVIVDLNTRDSLTLLTTNKTFLRRFGSEIRWEMAEEKKHSGGTNQMDWPPAQAVDTGKSEAVNGRETEIYSWSGAHGLIQTLWVDRNFPDFGAIKTELAKIDRFNDTGPHRNAQPALCLLPGMAVKTVTVFEGRAVTNTLVLAKPQPVDAALFELPADYSPWKRPAKNQP